MVPHQVRLAFGAGWPRLLPQGYDAVSASVGSVVLVNVGDGIDISSGDAVGHQCRRCSQMSLPEMVSDGTASDGAGCGEKCAGRVSVLAIVSDVSTGME